MGAAAKAAKPFIFRTRTIILQMSYVITGSPGTGKHSIAGIVSGRTGLPIIDINRAAAKAGIVRDGEVDTGLLPRIVDARRPSIILGHLAPHAVLPEMARFIKRAVVLRRSPYELESVYESRRYPRRKALDNLGAEILDVVYAEAVDAFGDATVQVDTTGGSPAHNAGKVMRAMAGGTSGSVDWLGTVQARGQMGRFFELNK